MSQLVHRTAHASASERFAIVLAIAPLQRGRFPPLCASDRHPTHLARGVFEIAPVGLDHGSEGEGGSPNRSTVRHYQKLLARPGFRAIVQAILDAVDKQADPEGTLAAIERLGRDTVNSQDEVISDASADLTLVLGCVEAFRERPTAATWECLWSLAWHSGLLKHGLPKAAIEAAKADRQFQSKFLEVAAEVAEHAIANPYRRVAARERSRGKQFREAWDSRPRLDNLWSGIDRHGIILPTDDDGVLGVVAELDLKTFMDLLVPRGDPYAIDATLLTASGYWSFARWQALVEKIRKCSPLVPIAELGEVAAYRCAPVHTGRVPVDATDSAVHRSAALTYRRSTDSGRPVPGSGGVARIPYGPGRCTRSDRSGATLEPMPPCLSAVAAFRAPRRPGSASASFLHVPA
jgi:hypothetical protein